MSPRRRLPALHAAVIALLWSTGGVLALMGVALDGPGVLVVGVAAAAIAGAVARGRGFRAARLRALAAGVVALAVCGLVAVAGIVAVPVVLLAAGIALVARHVRPAEAPPAGPGELAQLTPAELAREWRISYLRLGQARDPLTLATVVQLRARQLDEIERRDPAGYRRWVGSGNWVRCDSVPFLSG